MSRQGSVFRRCGCGGSAKGNRCSRCGRKNPPWRIKIDVAPVGRKRKIHNETFESKDDALATLQAIRSELATGRYVHQSSVSAGEYMSRWLEMVATDVAESTLRQYERYWRRLEPHLSQLRLQSVTEDDVRLAYRALQKDGLATGTIHSIHICLHHAFQDAVTRSLLPKNPAAGAHRARVVPKTDVLTEADLPRFYEACGSDRHGLFYIACLELGVRGGEGLAIRWRALNLEAGRVAIHRELIEIQKQTAAGLKTTLNFKETKSPSGLRTIALGHQMVELLKIHRDNQRQLRSALGLNWVEDDLVFAHVDGRPLNPSSMTTAFGNFRTRAGLPKEVSLHGLRRTFGAFASAQGMSAAVLCRALGHSRPGFTLWAYSPFLPGVDEDAVRRVAEGLRAKVTRRRTSAAAVAPFADRSQKKDRSHSGESL